METLTSETRGVDVYIRLEKVGEGTYGVVYKAQNKITGQLVAQKKIRLESETEGIPATALREISILRQLHHPNVVQLLDVVLEETKLHLIFEYLEQDLKQLLNKRRSGLPPFTLKLYLSQILSSILFCHKHRILHRDLKPQNILVSKDGQKIKLADFGLARAFQVPIHTYTHEVITLWYRPPEILLGSTRYSPGVDMWSVGCIFVEMATKKPLFPGDSEIDGLFKIFHVLGTPNDLTWAGVSNLPDYSGAFPQWKPEPLSRFLPGVEVEGVDLLQRMLVYDPLNRISAQAALDHSYFA